MDDSTVTAMSSMVTRGPRSTRKKTCQAAPFSWPFHGLSAPPGESQCQGIFDVSLEGACA